VKVLSLPMLFVGVSGAFGQTNSSFYVRPGNDSNPGTQPRLGAPFNTADTARAGSTVRRDISAS
jgi:hypothetical protein